MTQNPQRNIAKLWRRRVLVALTARTRGGGAYMLVLGIVSPCILLKALRTVVGESVKPAARWIISRVISFCPLACFSIFSATFKTLSTSFAPNLIGAPFGTVAAAGLSMERIVSGLCPVILCIVTQGIRSTTMFRTRRRSVSSTCRQPFTIADDSECTMQATKAWAEANQLEPCKCDMQRQRRCSTAMLQMMTALISKHIKNEHRRRSPLGGRLLMQSVTQYHHDVLRTRCDEQAKGGGLILA